MSEDESKPQPPQEAVGPKVKITWKLEKFDGDMKPGQEPVEVIEGEYAL